MCRIIRVRQAFTSVFAIPPDPTRTTLPRFDQGRGTDDTLTEPAIAAKDRRQAERLTRRDQESPGDRSLAAIITWWI